MSSEINGTNRAVESAQTAASSRYQMIDIKCTNAPFHNAENAVSAMAFAVPTEIARHFHPVSWLITGSAEDIGSWDSS